jgi:hypothetical protein
MPNSRFLLWTAAIALAVTLGYKHYEQRKAG